MSLWTDILNYRYEANMIKRNISVVLIVCRYIHDASVDKTRNDLASKNDSTTQNVLSIKRFVIQPCKMFWELNKE